MNEETIKANINKLGCATPVRVYKAGYKNAIKDIIKLMENPDVNVTKEYLKDVRNSIKL